MRTHQDDIVDDVVVVCIDDVVVVRTTDDDDMSIVDHIILSSDSTTGMNLHVDIVVVISDNTLSSSLACSCPRMVQSFDWVENLGMAWLCLGCGLYFLLDLDLEG